MYCFRIFKFTGFLIFITVRVSSINWDIKEEHLVYGHDVILTCNGTSCPPKTIKKWIGGPSFDLLCFDGYSTNETKYKMKFNHSRQEFYLIIKGFNFTDADCHYACSCGFQQYTNRLKLKDTNFIYLPVVDEDSSQQNGATFELDLLMKVFPLPKCEFNYETNSFLVNLTVKNVLKTRSNFELNTVRIQSTIDLKSYTCKGNVSLSCQVRSLKHRLLLRNIDFCEFEDDHDEHGADYGIKIIISVSCVLGFLILSTTIAFLIYKCVTKKWCNSETENHTDKESVKERFIFK